ncbi:DNA cytosine methyltransferase, partial [Agrobacterium pusense]|uniref:DNA cytosine methyltransferase n=1 Tax=Agrobacterium pusense TaxID=648995 RepID=UPI0035A6A5E9
LLQNADDLFFCKTIALHSLVLSMGQSLLQNGLFQRGKVTIDKDKHAIQTYQKNFPEVNALHMDVADFEPVDLGVNARDLILFGGPPCQGFSTSNRRIRGPENSKNWMFKDFLKLVSHYSPAATVVENVSGIKEGINKPIFEDMIQSLKHLGYHVNVLTLRSDHFGVPQKRTRVFTIGTKKHVELRYNEFHSTGATVKDALLDLPSLPNGHAIDEVDYASEAHSAYAEELRGALRRCGNHFVTNNASHIVERFRHVPQGGNWKSIPRDLLANYKDLTSCHTGIYRRLTWQEPSIVIGNFRKNMLIHPDQDRGLSVREAARLQSFPDNFSFLGSIGKQQQQVGNAVPPKLAFAVMSTIKRALA